MVIKFQTKMKKLLITLLIVFPFITHGLTATSTIFEVNNTGGATFSNGAGFDPENVNFATDLAADTNTGNTSAPVVSSASYNFVAGDIHAKLFIKAGTNAYTYCWYSISSIASNKATLDATAGNAVCLDHTKGFPSPIWATSTSAGIASSATPTGLTWGLDYSQYSNSVDNFTDLASTNGTTNPCTVTTASRTFGVNDIGNILHITSGTNWIQAWYTINNVSGGGASLLGACGTSATLSSGTAFEGGTYSMASSDDSFFENGKGDNATGYASRFMIKRSTGGLSLGQSVSIASAGGTQQPVIIEGYYQVRGDRPTSTSTMPTFTTNANTLTLGAQWDFYNINLSCTGATCLTLGAGGKLFNSKITNYSTTATRAAVSMAGAGNLVIGNELSSIRGYAVTAGANSMLINNYIHDSDACFRTTGGNLYQNLIGNICSNTTTNGLIITTAGITGMLNLFGNTFYNPTNLGIGVNGGIAGSRNIRLMNNIITGYATGTSMVETVTPNDGFDDFNDYYNNTLDKYMWIKGSNDIAVNPTFGNVSVISGTNASSSTNVLTDGTNNFSTITDDIDYVTLTSGTGTGFTAGSYPIHSHTNTTLTLATPGNSAFNITSSGAGSAISYQIVEGYDFSVGTNLKALAYPGLFPGGYTQGYLDIGAVQRQETGGGGTTLLFSLPYMSITK